MIQMSHPICSVIMITMLWKMMAHGAATKSGITPMNWLAALISIKRNFEIRVGSAIWVKVRLALIIFLKKRALNIYATLPLQIPINLFVCRVRKVWK